MPETDTEKAFEGLDLKAAGKKGPGRPKREAPKVPVYDLTPLDPTQVDGKDPNFFYYFSDENPMDVQKWKRRGFEVVTGGNESPGDQAKPTALSNAADSSFLNPPGLILMRCPKEVNDARVTAQRARFESMHDKDEEETERMDNYMKKLGGRFRKTERDGLGIDD